MTILVIILVLLILVVLFGLYVKFRKRIPVLMYHRLATIPGDRNALPPEKFRKQLDYLVNHGFTTITMQMLFDYYQHGKKLPPKPILLTFDDGYQDNFDIALPLLKERKMTATVFPISAWVGKENKWENFNKKLTRTMDWQQLKIWQANGMEIGSHTVNHPFLADCQTAELTTELIQSKASLERFFQMPIDFLCYPYGNFNTQTKAAAKQTGYKAAFAIFKNVSLWHIDLFALPRIPIPARQSLFEFKLKVSSIHVIFIALRLWEQGFKRLFRKK